MNGRSTDLLLGVIFFATMAGLGVVTIALSDFKLGVDSHDVRLVSPDVGYLRIGDPVLLQGMPVGKVRSIDRLPETITVPQPDGPPLRCTVEIEVRLEADPYPLLRADHAVRIEERGLLGGRLVRFDLGTSPRTWDGEGPLVALARPSLTQAAVNLIEENRSQLQLAISNAADTFRLARDGDGAIGALLNDDVLAADLRAGLSDLRGITGRIGTGEGTLGRLLHDGTLYDEADALLAGWTGVSRDASELLAEVRAGRGTLGKLVSDETLYADARRFFDGSAALVDDVRAGRGTLGRLANDPSLYDDVATFFSDARAVASEVREGEGLLGALLSDEKLAEDFKAILRQVLGAVEDARETAPVQSLGSFLFGTF